MLFLDSVSIMKGIFSCLNRDDDIKVRKGPSLNLQQLTVLKMTMKTGEISKYTERCRRWKTTLLIGA